MSFIANATVIAIVTLLQCRPEAVNIARVNETLNITKFCTFEQKYFWCIHFTGLEAEVTGLEVPQHLQNIISKHMQQLGGQKIVKCILEVIVAFWTIKNITK